MVGEKTPANRIKLMGKKIIDLSEFQAKNLYYEARHKEIETGKSIEEILIRIIYESDDDMARVTAMRAYY
jgi:hypothetical protein